MMKISSLVSPRLLTAIACVSLLAGCGVVSPVTSTTTTSVTLQSTPLAAATVGVPYGAAIVATDGVKPYQFSLSAGLLPAGFVLSSDGVLSGMPSTPGTFNFTITVADATAQKTSSAFSFVIAPAATTTISFTTSSLAVGTAGLPYSSAIVVTNGTAPYTFSITAGALPAGLALSAAGVLTGMPTTPGNSSFTATVHDAASRTASATYGVTIAFPIAPLSIPATTLPTATVGIPYTSTIQVSGGLAPYTYSSASGSLPAGLTLSSTGVLSGTPTSAVTSSFMLTVRDAATQQATALLTLTVLPSVALVTTSLPSATVAAPYTATLVAANGTAPYIFSVISGALPAGLSLAGNTIFGTPTSQGSSTFTISVADSAAQRASAVYTISIAPALVLITPPLGQGVVGASYDAQFFADNGTKPFLFAITSGTLPPGLTMDATGLLSGTPTAAGTFPFTLSVTDAAGLHATATYSLLIVLPLAITTPPLGPGQVGSPYDAQFYAANGTAPYTFAVKSGTLPPGFTLSTTGFLSATPTAAGTYPFTIEASDAAGQHASTDYSITIALPLTLTTPPLGPGQVGASYHAQFFAENGTQPYTFSVTNGALPGGLTLTSAGVLDGTPTTAGTANFAITVVDAAGLQAHADYTLVIAAPLTLTTPPLGPGQVGASYHAQFFAENGTQPYTFSVTSGSLPSGFTLTSAGILDGTATTAGTANFTITVVDAAALQAHTDYTLVIAAPLVLTTPPLGPGQLGAAYHAQFYAENGTQPYTFAVTSGALPAGFNLTTAGYLEGTATVSGTATFTLTVTDANGQTASLVYTLVINGSLVLTTPPLGPGQVGAAYHAQFYADGGTQPYTFAVTSGALPAGFTLTPAGFLAGTPTTSGTASFTITATDAAAQTASLSYTLAITGSGTGTGTGTGSSFGIANNHVPDATLQQPYSASLAFTGGTAPYTVTLISGTLPAGLTLSSDGTITGTPTATGASTFTLSLADGGTPQQSATATLTLNVFDPAHVTVTIDTTNVLATIPAGAYGLHTSVYDGQLSDVSAIPSLLHTAGITTLRYPGGSYSDRFHWAQNSLTPLYASAPGACGVLTGELYLAQHTDFGYFIRTLQASGAQALITVNYGTSVADSHASLTNGTDGTSGHCSEPNSPGQPQEAAAWVAYANGDPSSTQLIGLDAVGFDWKTVGFWASLRAATPLSADDGYNFLRLGLTAPIGIQNWELGNEMYYNGWDGNRNFEADLHAPFIYPNGYSGGYYESRDHVAALSPTAYGTNAVQFIQAMKAVDPSIKIGLDLSSPIVDPIEFTWNPDVMRAACAGTNFDIAVIHYYPGTYLNVQASEMLSLPQVDFPFVVNGIRAQLAQYCPVNAANMKVFVTETSPNGTVNGGVPFPVTGLFAMHTYLSAMEVGVANLDWLEMHNGTFLDTSENPGPSFFGIQLAHQLAAPGDALVHASSSSSTVVAHATVKANGQKGLVLINADSSNPAAVQVSIPNASLGSQATQYTYGVATQQNSPTLSSTTFPITGNTFTVTVPPYTAVELLIP